MLSKIHKKKFLLKISSANYIIKIHIKNQINLAKHIRKTKYSLKKYIFFRKIENLTKIIKIEKINKKLDFPLILNKI